MKLARRTVLILALLLGFGVGLAVALYLAWMVWPVEYAESDPADLEPALREGYLILIAEGYDQDGNLEKARSRLARVARPGENPVALLAALTQKYLDEGLDLRTLRKLVRLTHALGASTGEMLVYLPADQPTPTRTPTPAPQPSPTATPPGPPPATPTPAPAYRLVERRRLCSAEEGPGQVQVVVRDEAGQGLPGVRVQVTWPEGTETIFTGFKPEQGDGYADAQMWVRGEYRVTVLQGNGGEVVGGLYADPDTAGCPAEARSVTWQVVFQRAAP
ncbi:MAG: hypothetical protein ACP5UM_14195 [Anaerolineae bacterium]